jgi:hypothetical protein
LSTAEELGDWLLDAARRRIAMKIVASLEALLDGDYQRFEEIADSLNQLHPGVLALAEHRLVCELVFSSDDPRDLLTRAEMQLIDRPDPPILEGPI